MLHRGRLPAQALTIGDARELTIDDLACLRDKRTTSSIARMRDPHHRLARLIAAGVRPKEAAEQTGFSISRVYVLHSDPSFKDLVAAYRKDVSDAYISAEEERYRMATEVNLKALRHISEAFDKADEEGELVPLPRALSVFADTSDRVGLMKKSVNFNVNQDFAKNLEAARARSARVLDASPTLAPAGTEGAPNKSLRRI